MGVVLELRCPQDVDGVSIDPEPNWNFDTLVSEISSLEKKISTNSRFPTKFTKTASRDVSRGKRVDRNSRGFIMRVLEDDMESIDDESDEETIQSSVVARRFTCDDLYLSDDSDDDSAQDAESYLMSEVGRAEGALCELTHDHQLEIKEEIRNQISAVETEMISEIEITRSALDRVEKYRDTRLEVERKLDLLYQRKVAEALDSHLTAIQHEHELKSQIEERKIRSDAAHEEAKKRERALQEEKLRQEKARAEAEIQAKLRAEEAKREAERSAKEAAEKQAFERRAAEQKAAEQKLAEQKAAEASKAVSPVQGSTGNLQRASESALNLEQQRQKKLKELEEMNRSLRSNSSEDFSSFERHISRIIRQISGAKDNVSSKASEIIKIFNNPRCPQSISLAAFAEKVVASCENPNNPPFACGYVIVLVTSKFPHAMDIILAEFNKACIYTVPKHVTYSESAFESKEAYRKALGFQEIDGKVESFDSYLKRTDSCMKLYGALIQTEASRLGEGWAWLARFLNSVPVNKLTATALNGFLQMAGFALHRKYKSQFVKILNTIREHFLSKLKAKQDSSDLVPIITEIKTYLEDRKHLQEPEGRSLQSNLLSREITPESDYQDSYNNQNRYWS